jgi:sulfide:quinone oxidoreductase
MRRLADHAVHLVTDPVGHEALQSFSTFVEHTERDVARAGDVCSGFEDAPEHRLRVKIGTERPRRLQQPAQHSLVERVVPPGHVRHASRMGQARHVLVAGGGPAALEGALATQRLAGDRVRITLLSDRDAFTYRPLAVTEPFGFAAPARVSLDAIAADRGFSRERGTLSAVDAPAHRVSLQDGTQLAYDALLLAVGAKAASALPGALSFGGHDDVARVRTALTSLDGGAQLRVACVAGPDTQWTLPAYELAFLTARWAADRGLALESWIVTHEPRALALFGEQASRSITELLEAACVRLWTDARAESVADGRLWLGRDGGLAVDVAIALPKAVARRIDGLPTDSRGFVVVDELGRVEGLPDVYAAGDMTARPLKQGGLATQQADAAASAIAAWSGAPVTPEPYRPVLRGMLVTGAGTRPLGRDEAIGSVTDQAPEWLPEKISARELGPYLAAHPEFALTASGSVGA